MLEKPDFPDEKIIACLQAEYGLPIAKVAFLPLGGDLSTAVYQAVTDDETLYFCKLKRGIFDETSVALPKFLSGQGLTQIIPSLITQTGRLWAVLDEFKLILYPFVEGIHGYDVELSERQWADFGTALKRLHTTIIPSALIDNIRKEQYSSEWRQRCRNIFKRIDNEKFDDPITVAMAVFLHSKREMIIDAIERAEQLAYDMSAQK